MSNRAKNWVAAQFAPAGAYVQVIVENIDRRGLIIFNTSGVDLLLNVNETAADATSYTVPAGQTFDFYDQPPIRNCRVKAASGNVLVWEA